MGGAMNLGAKKIKDGLQIPTVVESELPPPVELLLMHCEPVCSVEHKENRCVLPFEQEAQSNKPQWEGQS